MQESRLLRPGLAYDEITTVRSVAGKPRRPQSDVEK